MSRRVATCHGMPRHGPSHHVIARHVTAYYTSPRQVTSPHVKACSGSWEWKQRLLNHYRLTHFMPWKLLETEDVNKAGWTTMVEKLRSLHVLQIEDENGLSIGSWTTPLTSCPGSWGCRGRWTTSYRARPRRSPRRARAGFATPPCGGRCGARGPCPASLASPRRSSDGIKAMPAVKQGNGVKEDEGTRRRKKTKGTLTRKSKQPNIRMTTTTSVTTKRKRKKDSSSSNNNNGKNSDGNNKNKNKNKSHTKNKNKNTNNKNKKKKGAIKVAPFRRNVSGSSGHQPLYLSNYPTIVSG